MSSFLLEYFTGLSHYQDRGQKGAFKFGSGLDVRRDLSSLKAGQALKDDLAVSGIMDAPVVQVVNASDGNSYWGLSNGKILKRTSVGVWSLVYTDAENVLYSLAEWGNSNNETGLYWTTLTKLHRHKIGGNWTTDVDANAGSPAQTYPKTNLTSSTEHFMTPVNGALLGCNGDRLFMVGYDESYTNDALRLLPGNVSKMIQDSGVYATIVANVSSVAEQSWVYTWDMISLSYNSRTLLPFKSINSILETEATVIQYGTEGKLYFIGDTSKLPVTSFPGGGQVKKAGVDNDNGLALFGVYGNGTGKSGIYSWGRVIKDDTFTLNLDNPLTCDSIEVVKKIGTERFVAYSLNSTYGVKKVDTANKIATAKMESIDLKLPFVRGGMNTLHEITVEMAPLPAGCSVELWRRVDRKITDPGYDYAGNDTGLNDGWRQCMLSDLSGSYATEGGTEAVFDAGDDCKFAEIRAVLNCSGNSSPEIYRIWPTF